MPNVVVDDALAESGQSLVVAKLSDDRWELNVMVRKPEFLALQEIRDLDWDSRRVAKVGVSAGTDVFWCSDGEVATIMVGRDDETWDFAVTVPLQLVDDLVRQVADL